MKNHLKQNIKSIIVITSIITTLTIAAHLLAANQTTQLQYNQNQSPRNLYTTNTNRLSIVSTYCQITPSTISESDRTTMQMYNSSLSTYFKANATTLINSLFNSNFGTFNKELQINGAGTFAFISPYVIGLALLLLAWPFFLCCCICQNDCPAKCCRSKNPNYNSGDLNWVTVVLIITAILLSVTSIPSMTNTRRYFSQFNCKAAQLLDNFQNGNSTSDQKYFFAGLTTIRSELTGTLSPKLPQLSAQITRIAGSVGSALDTTKTNAANTKTTLQNMPNGGNNLQFSITYSYPLESSTSSGSLATVLGTKIGTFSSASTLLGSLYSYINKLESNLTDITTAASGVNPHLTAGDMGVEITTVDTILAQVQDSLNNVQTTLTGVMKLLQKIDSYYVQYAYALYGTIMALGILTIIGIIFVKCFSIISCRHFLYLLCITSFFVAIILFALAILLAIGMSTSYYSCVYLGNTFTNPNRFSNTINNLIGSSSSSLPNYFSQCFGGTNDFITVVNPTFSGYISQLKTAVFNSALYSFTDMTTNLTSQLNTMKTTIDNYGLGHLPDFDLSTVEGQAQILYFNKVANKSLFTASCPSGSYPVFYQDAWVPGLSTTYQSYVSCQGKIQQDASVCSSGIAAVGSCPSSRCMDTFSLINLYYRGGNIGNLIPNADTRYGSACTPFDDYLTNYYTNYVKVVVDSIGNYANDNSNSSRLAGRFNINAKTPVQSLENDMNTNIHPLFTEVYGNITTTAGLGSIFDTEAGLITGLDCRLLSQNGVSMKQAFCIQSFNRMFFSLVTVGIMCFAMFLLICCLLCFNVRHYQQWLQMNGRQKVFPLDQTDSSIKMG